MCIRDRVYGLSDGFTQKIIVTFSDKRAREIGAEYGFYDRRTMVYPGKDLIFYQADVSGGDLVRERMRVLRALLEKRPVTIVTTMSALMMPQTPLSGIVSRMLHFDKKSTVDERKLSAQLVEMGYEKSPQVEEPGQFSIREMCIRDSSLSMCRKRHGKKFSRNGNRKRASSRARRVSISRARARSAVWKGIRTLWRKKYRSWIPSW